MHILPKKFNFNDSRGGLTKITNIPNNFNVKQVIVSKTQKALTARGLHYASEPKSESKIISCVQGSVIWVSINRISEEIIEMESRKLSSTDNELYFVPKGRIHGCIISEDDTLIQIISNNDYDPNCSVHYEWGDLLKEVCIKNRINPELVWDSEKDTSHKRISLKYKKSIYSK